MNSNGAQLLSVFYNPQADYYHWQKQGVTLSRVAFINDKKETKRMALFPRGKEILEHIV